MKISIGPRQLAYESVGNGPALVLVHAFPFDSRMWRKASAALAGQRRVITPDMRGFGLSDLGSGDHSIADMADDVAALLDALKLPAATVGGMSMGGYVALAFAVAIAIDCSPLYWPTPRPRRTAPMLARVDRPPSRWWKRRAWQPYSKSKFHACCRPRPVKACVPRCAGWEPNRPMPSLPRSAPCATGPTALPSCRDRSAHSGCGGHPGRAFPARGRPAMAASMPRARVVEIPGAGHLSNLENPDAFAAALAGFS